MRNVKNLLALLAVTLLLVSTSLATNNKSGDKGKKEKAKKELTEKGNKALKGMMVLDKMPVLDKNICNLDLDFDLVIDGNQLDILNKSVGEFSDVEIIYGDGNIANNFESVHKYEKSGVHYIAISIFDKNTGCIDFVGANIFIGDKGNEELNKVIISAKDLKADEVANLLD